MTKPIQAQIDFLKGELAKQIEVTSSLKQLNQQVEVFVKKLNTLSGTPNPEVFEILDEIEATIKSVSTRLGIEK